MDEVGIEARRQMLIRFGAMTAAAFALPWSLRAQVGHPSPQPMASPNAPMNQNVPGGLDGAGLAHQPAPGTISPLMWAEIKSDSDKLLQMAKDFKAKVDQTNLTATLSLPLIKEAHQIEKMAKEIQQRMRA